MFGDDDNKKVFRDQVIGLLLITAIVIGWSYFFIPSPPQKTVKDNGNSAVNQVDKQVSENTAPLQTSEQKSPIKDEDVEREKKNEHKYPDGHPKPIIYSYLSEWLTEDLKAINLIPQSPSPLEKN